MRTKLFLYGLFCAVTAAHVLVAQEVQKEPEKKTPGNEMLEIVPPEPDTAKSALPETEKPLPKIDLPEYVITGSGSADVSASEKIPFSDGEDAQQRRKREIGSTQRDRETTTFDGSPSGSSMSSQGAYSGTAYAGIGSYFSPDAGLWFGQSLQTFQYTLGGTYHLTKGYAPHMDQSGGDFSASGRAILASSSSLFHNASVDGSAGFGSESYRFYGSAQPELQRTLSNFSVRAGMENQDNGIVPYSAGFALSGISVEDSSSVEELCLRVNGQLGLPVDSLPLQVKIQGMVASGGLSFFDLSGGIQNYGFAGLLFDGSLHLFWAKGMNGQNIVRIHPNLLLSFHVLPEHRLFVSYEPKIQPMTLAENIRFNRYISAGSRIRHTDVLHSGEIGLESDWTAALRSRVSFTVQSLKDLMMITDSSRHGIWSTGYGGQATCVTFNAEIVAKFNSNDYFASHIMLQSTKDSFTGNRIPYYPVLEAGCRAQYSLTAAITLSAQAKFVGERQADILGNTLAAGYSIIDGECEYSPFPYLKFSAGILNGTNAHYEIWRGYRETPITIHAAVQVKW